MPLYYGLEDSPCSTEWIDVYYAPAINVMPHYPLPGYRGEMVGHLTCFDTKNCPIHGEFDCQPYVCAIIISTDSQIPLLFLDF